MIYKSNAHGSSGKLETYVRLLSGILEKNEHAKNFTRRIDFLGE